MENGNSACSISIGYDDQYFDIISRIEGEIQWIHEMVESTQKSSLLQEPGTDSSELSRQIKSVYNVALDVQKDLQKMRTYANIQSKDLSVETMQKYRSYSSRLQWYLKNLETTAENVWWPERLSSESYEASLKIGSEKSKKIETKNDKKKLSRDILGLLQNVNADDDLEDKTQESTPAKIPTDLKYSSTKKEAESENESFEVLNSSEVILKLLQNMNMNPKPNDENKNNNRLKPKDNLLLLMKSANDSPSRGLAEDDEELLRAKLMSLAAIQEDIIGLHQLTQELAGFVESSDRVIQNLENSTHQTVVDTSGAVEQLAAAREHQADRAKKIIWMTIWAFLALGFVLLFLKA